MQTEGTKPFNAVDYFPLQNGYADVFMHKSMGTRKDEEGKTIYLAEEVYFQIDQSVTKALIEANFDLMWMDALKAPEAKPTLEERVTETEAITGQILDTLAVSLGVIL